VDQFAEERRRGVELLRNSSTYFGRALVDGDGGRYAQVGAVAIGEPLPPAVEWLRDPVPNEPPLGYEIDAIDDARS